ncbi:hypothetical protein SD427_09375 [Chryseobacterium sp. JJR-5R]|uniref:hypothetical protein n=1 Tax=Chryseobacterium sp. JJR-5R TaxID=3093923 RepID=UPI002A75A9F2|nr:hypothetical protein [Chryseobacterium sp. JJR-5R]WPO80971.1 hypothetical protein SD427_09375 [Chryseobacterium sp. JJR-5R]
MKKNMLNKWKSDYEGLEIKPSADLWDRLDHQLDSHQKSEPRSYGQWWKYAAIIFLMISVGTVIYFNGYKNRIDDKQTKVMAKKVFKNKINPVNVDSERQNTLPNQEVLEGKTDQVIAKVTENNNPEIPVQKKEEIRNQDRDQSQTQVFVQHHTDKALPEIIINKNEKAAEFTQNPVVLAETKKAKPGYINADELLLGREFEKTRENTAKEERKFGVFRLKKVVPNVDNVTVLGVKVYIDPK